jgi:hypothetical protein
MPGDVPAVLTVLHIVDQRIRLMGLAEPSPKPSRQDAWPSCQGPATVVERHGRFTDSPTAS